VGCGAAQKKERNIAQTESAVKQDRLCVACLSAEINRLSARRVISGRREAALVFGRGAALVFGQVRLGCVFEGRIVQKRAGSRMDVLLLGLIDYPCLVEAVGLYGHQSRGRGVFNRKN